MFNKFKPTRTHDEILHYRTHISHPSSAYKPFDSRNIAAQVMLYRWSRSDEFINYVSINTLYLNLFWQVFSVAKRQMGATVLQSLKYDPRMLKGKTKDNDVACMCYMIRDKRELQYGLEWLMSLWIWRLEDDEPSQENVAKFLDDLAGASEEEAIDVWIRPVEEGMWIHEPPLFTDWKSIWAENQWEYEQVRRKERPDERPPISPA